MTDRGYFWLAQMPDGKYAILYCDPTLKRVHHQRAIADDYKAAKAYARANHIDLHEPKLASQDKPDRGQKYVELAKLILAMLDDLYAIYPEGIDTKVITETFQADYHLVLEALRWLNKKQLAIWTHHKSKNKLLFPLNATLPQPKAVTIEPSRPVPFRGAEAAALNAGPRPVFATTKVINDNNT